MKVKNMLRVVIESPYAGTAGEVEKHLAYLSECLRDSLSRGEAPVASHGLLTRPGVLDDTIPAERKHGIRAGWAWLGVADRVAVYEDLGISDGMARSIERAEKAGVVVVYRKIRAAGG